MDFNCPKCSSDNTQKISSIVEAGTTKTTGTTQSVGVASVRGGLGVGTSVGTINATSKTALATKLASPVKQNSFVFYVLMVSIPFLIVVIFPWYLGYPLAGFIGWMLFQKADKAKTYNREVFPGLLSNWQSSFYCHRCDNSFIPA